MKILIVDSKDLWDVAVVQNLRYVFCRVPYHLFKKLLRVTGGTGF